jgi:glycosyltransferase involved in cell wall biosynthesis
MLKIFLSSSGIVRARQQYLPGKSELKNLIKQCFLKTCDNYPFMNVSKVSVIIPIYNEEKTIAHVLDKVTRAEIDNNISEVIVINDYSDDNSEKEINAFLKTYPGTNVFLYNHPKNMGKGACIRTALQYATGELVIIQDADLEYDPEDYKLLLKPFRDGKADVVYGSRFVGNNPHRVLLFHHYLANRLLTFLSNLLTGLNLTDMETGFKVFRLEVLKQIRLKEKRFGFEPEVTAKVSKIKGIRIYEIGISYYGRTYKEGKKINWKDGLRTLYCILRYNIWAR